PSYIITITLSSPLFITFSFFFFFTAPSTTEIYTLSLHDALPIYVIPASAATDAARKRLCCAQRRYHRSTYASNAKRPRNPMKMLDRKSTRLNSSHDQISYAVFCLKKKKKKTKEDNNKNKY